ncbi:hypothetical protein [Limnohabitans sp. 2KL-3]|uniref:hypothetical protein n=1 Tax=Limnohabitans sp. 2KL-3 TaxID=1100700 RepID=UPI000AD13FDC|nr:hypothetical protein [Limnohabitans sp. 2KL-3]
MALSGRIGYRSTPNSELSSQSIDLGNWPMVDENSLSAARKTKFLARKKAIELYLKGATDAVLQKKTGEKRSNIYRIITNRCLQRHSDGDIFGWRGALPHFRVTAYERQTAPVVHENGAGATGALKWLLERPQFKDLKDRFHKRILNNADSLAHPKINVQTIFRWFIDELRKAGLEDQKAWPFNSESLGYESVRLYIKKVLAEHPFLAMSKMGGPDAIAKAKASDGTRRPDFKLFDRVECDAHKLDCRMVVMVPSPHGGYEPRKIRRIWIIVIIDVRSRAVLGYHISLRRECSALDVLITIKNALSKWAPRTLTFCEDGYAEGAALPSAHSEVYLSACWNEFSVDGALANVCPRVEEPLLHIVGAKVIKPQDPMSYSSRRSKDDRPFIESFFRVLASGTMHRLSPSTGSSHEDKKGRDPEKIAAEVQFQLDYAEELLDVTIANYNATPHTGLGYRSPLAQMDFLSSKTKNRIRHADPELVKRMAGTRKVCTLLGGEYTGKRSYFNFENAKYTSEWLVQRPDLLGKKLWLQLDDETDARWATVSDSNGLIYGTVHVQPPWHRSPHTLYMRQAIRALATKRLLFLTGNRDPVQALIEYAEIQANKKLPVHPAYLHAYSSDVDQSTQQRDQLVQSL